MAYDYDNEFDDESYPEGEAPPWDNASFSPEDAEALRSQTEELYSIPDAQPDADGLITLPAVVLPDSIVLPHLIAPLILSGEENVAAVRAAAESGTTLAVFMLGDLEKPNPTWGDVFVIGVEAAAGFPYAMPNEAYAALMQGRRRVELVEVLQSSPYPLVRVRPLDFEEPDDEETQALMTLARRNFERFVELNDALPEEAFLYALNADQPGWLADLIAMALSPSHEELLAFLSEVEPKARLKRVVEALSQAVARLELEDEIQSRVQSEMDRTQREAYLREQMRAIQTELGEGDFWTQEINELRARVEKADLPDEPRERALKEIERLKQLPPMAPEVGILRTYIEWILDLPWKAQTEDNLDLKHAAEVLEEHHYGLPKAKERILEYIAVRSLKPKRTRQPILCFVGPPGTGKTSLGRSIAEALGRKFVRVSLGGVRDEAEIRGHRRTYIGALPGRILQTMKRAGTINPVFMLDEVDKLGTDFRGDPSSALLEVLDPEQNNAFSDHYLEIPYDLSQVMFITTANSLATIPPALLDRMEVIEFPGYVEEEKVHIARRFLIPRQMEESGLEPDEVHFTEPALRKIIREYTSEAGVRNLEREIGRVCRKIARLKAEGKRYPSRITERTVMRFLGPPVYFDMEAEQEDEIGVAMGLAWTTDGGVVMPVEVLLMDGKGDVKITGQIGDVMQESAQAALSYLRAHSREWGLDPEIFEKTDVHIHVPEGAVPKDGPSAGVTLATALISAFTQRPVRHDVAMTGEITLRGKVLPVGGVREKVLAAHRHGLKTVILPQRNIKDLEDVPKSARQALRVVPVRRLEEVLAEALLPAQPSEEDAEAEEKDVADDAAFEEAARDADLSADEMPEAPAE